MTCKEKLAIEHPDRVDPKYKGGAVGCPSMYGYLADPERCRLDHCDECWNREIPEVENEVS